ncbi:DUF3240 family protein [Pseudomonas fluorescens]|uniref:DUF3240 family protein n=1 Tax=Pseudomonas fluorescens TaxID=294 RepID=UPI00209A9BB3|nr:DUF3240 family protein [Pseudomonas fluorescens]MCO7624901.1 DUF3240 family protein [Pseudomonas fluorescens]
MSNVRVTLLTPSSHEEKLFDFFLCDPSIGIFTSRTVSVHGLANSILSPAEQVMGSAKETEIVIVVQEERFDLWISDLKTHFKGSSIRYWSSPVCCSGVLV